MNRTDAPKKQAVPFAVNGQREELLPTSPAGDNTASYDAGFPAVTMILKAAGGLPPKGQDMNQILFELSSLARWFSTGSINSYDATFSAEIGGYPKGAIVLGEDGNTRYMSTAEDNTSDPNTDGAGWFNLSAGYLKTENNLSEIKGAGPDAIASALTNLGLGEAAKRGVGNGANQIPDMNYFAATLGSNSSGNSASFPNGLIIKHGNTTSSVGPDNAVTFPAAFPTGVIAVVGSYNASTSSQFFTFNSITRNGFNFRGYLGNAMSNPAGAGMTCTWIALGY